LDLKCDFLVSKFAFKFNLYHYTAVRRVETSTKRAELHESVVRSLSDNIYTLAAVVGVGLLAVAALAFLVLRRLLSFMATAQQARAGAGRGGGAAAYRSQV
jgi:hypothetical protein